MYIHKHIETGKDAVIYTEYPDGGNYLGQVTDENTRNGEGIYHYAGGDIYFGTFRDEKFHGQGITPIYSGCYMFESGEYYEGELYEGMKDGEGTYVYTDNKYYHGNWKNDLKNGFGIYEDPGKEKYEGEWVNGLR